MNQVNPNAHFCRAANTLTMLNGKEGPMLGDEVTTGNMKDHGLHLYLGEVK